MRAGEVRLRLFGAVLAAFVLQTAFGSAWSVRGARPDIALVTALVCSLFVGPRAASGLGFALGILQASWVDRLVGSLIVSRTLAAWTVGLLEDVVFRDSPIVAMGIAAAGTLAAEGSFFLFAPQPHYARFFSRAAVQAGLNGLAALPIYYAVRRLSRPKAQ